MAAGRDDPPDESGDCRRKGTTEGKLWGELTGIHGQRPTQVNTIQFQEYVI